MTTRRRYSKAEKLAAIATAEMTNATAAASSTGIPESTIRYWLDSPRFAELRAKTREEDAQAFSVLMRAAQEALFRAIPTMEPRDLTVLLGVAADKTALFSGEATARTETKAITEGLDDHKRRALRDLIDEALATPAAPVGGDPV